MEERLQKMLARAGLGSRRACEELIRQRRVRVNGQAALQLHAQGQPDLVILDWMLPKVDGLSSGWRYSACNWWSGTGVRGWTAWVGRRFCSCLAFSGSRIER
jgi:hypothetical protein